MRFTKSVFFAVPAALAIAMGAVAATDSTAEKHGDRGDRSERRIERMKEKLGLSDDQVKSLQAVFASSKEDRREGGADFHKAMTDFRKAALEGNSKTVASKRDAILKAHGDRLDKQAEKLAKIGEILTPEQRTKFAEMKGKGFHGKKHGRHHRHGDAGNHEDSPAAE